MIPTDLETITYEEGDDGVAVVTLNRPEVHNAFNSLMQRELRAVWRALREAVRIIAPTADAASRICALEPAARARVCVVLEAADPGFRPDFDALVYSVALQVDGRILVGGAFTQVNGHPQSGIARYTFDNLYLWGGLDLVPVLVGIFAIPEIIDLAVRRTSIAGGLPAGNLTMGGNSNSLPTVGLMAQVMRPPWPWHWLM